MPRQARLDAPGLLQHVIVRGLDRRDIFLAEDDYQDFLDRVESSLQKSPNQILAWALMPNHVHLLVRSGPEGLSRFMRRLTSGYAVSFNARHQRSGYLFQNRFKSIVCDEDSYFLELVRYIHLNPLRAGIVNTLGQLDHFPHTGHSSLLGLKKRPWQDTDDVLERFGSRARYRQFMLEGLTQGRRPELVGGGLRRSRGRPEGPREAFDDRVLGGGDFVEKVWRRTGVGKDPDAPRRPAVSFDSASERIAREAGIDVRSLFRRGRTTPVSRAKAWLCHVGADHFGMSLTKLAVLTGMSVPAASKARRRGSVDLNDAELAGRILS